MLNKKRVFAAWLLVIGSAGAIAANAAPNDQRWIVGSYVNIHDAPDDKATVATHLTTNTSVKLLAESGRYCQIAWGDQSGYIVCRYLGEKPLQLHDVEPDPANADALVPNSSPLRAFWIEPSYQRFIAAGSYFEQTMLTDAVRKKEAARVALGSEGNPPKDMYFTRYPIPEFDAMKARMQAGVQAEPLPEHPYPNTKELLEKMRTSTLEGSGPYLAYLLDAKNHFLPKLNSAFFNDQRDIGSMTGETEWLSALFQIPYKVEALSKPYVVYPHYNDPFISGSWDIGDTKLYLAQPIFNVGVYKDGTVKVEETKAIERMIWYADIEATEECGSFVIDSHLRKKASMDYVESDLAPENLLLYFRQTKPWDVRHAKIAKSDNYSQASSTRNGVIIPFYRITSYLVTFDGHNAPDFQMIDVWGESEFSPADLDPKVGKAIQPVERFYFVNIGKQWRLLDRDSLQGCS